MKHISYIAWISILLLTTACNTATSIVPTPTAMPVTAIPSQTPTPLPTLASTPTIAPTFTSTPTPRLPISADNLNDLTLIGQLGGIGGFDVAWSQDGKYLALANNAGVTLYNGTTYSEVKKLEMSVGVHAVIFKGDGAQILAMGSNGSGQIWDLNSWQVVQSFKQLLDVQNFCPNGMTLTAYGWGTAEEKLICLDERSKQIMDNLINKGPSVSVSQDNKLAAIGYRDDVFIFDFDSGRLFNQWVPPSSGNVQVSAVSISPDNKFVVFGGDSGVARVLNPQTGDLIADLQIGFPLKGMAFRSDGKYLAIITVGRFVIASVDTNFQQVDIGNESPGRVAKLTFSNDGNYLATASDQCVFRLWDLKSGQPALKVSGENFSDDESRWGAIEGGGMAISPDEKLNAVGDNGGASIWDIQSKTKIKPLDVQKVVSMAFSPDGSLLATGTETILKGQTWIGGGIKLWDVKTGQLIATLDGNPTIDEKANRSYNIVYRLVFSPNGEELASLGLDGIRLWQVSDGKLLQKIDGFEYITSDWTMIAKYTSIAMVIVLMKNGKTDLYHPINLYDASYPYQISPNDDLTFSYTRTGNDIGDGVTLNFLDIKKTKVIQSMDVKIESVYDFRFALSPEGSLLAVTTEGGNVSLYSIKQ
jgi:WD40 repeat protein